MVSYFPLISSVISAIFAILLAIQYVQRRKKHQLIWTTAFIMFFLATLLEFSAEPEIMGGTVLMYQIYYALAPVMVALLGAGTLYLLADKPWGKYFLVYTVILSIPFFAMVSTASIDPSAVAQGFSTAGKAMPRNVRYLSPLFTIPGAAFLIGGAIYTFWLDRTRKYSLLFASGGIFFLLGGLMARFGNPTILSPFHFIGILLMFLGFLLSRKHVKKGS